MRRVALSFLVFVSVSVFLTPESKAAVAIAIGIKGGRHIVVVAVGYNGHLARQNVVKYINKRKPETFRVAGWCDSVGYTAVASSTRGYALGWAMGKLSAREAERWAIANQKRRRTAEPFAVPSSGCCA